MAMRFSHAAALSLLMTVAASGASRKIDLRTKEGVLAVKGQWRYVDVKIVDSVGKAPDGSPNKTYNYEPNATAVVKSDYDDSKWELVDPTTLKDSRGGGQVCFGWYRIKVTIPADIPAGKKVFFQTVVDDYGEVWVDGKLPRKLGDMGGPVVAGFNAPNRVELKDVQPGKTYLIALFAINGPISATPGNWLFLREAFLDVVD